MRKHRDLLVELLLARAVGRGTRARPVRGRTGVSVLPIHSKPGRGTRRAARLQFVRRHGSAGAWLLFCLAYIVAEIAEFLGEAAMISKQIVPLLATATLTVLFAMQGMSHAEVLRFEIKSIEPFGEKSFGDVGPYERVIGQVHYAIDPSLPQNQAIRDLDLAPRDQTGKVQFQADLFVLLPKDRSHANGAILHDVNNRGNKLALSFFNSAGGNRKRSTG